MSYSVQPHRWQLTRLPCPWDSPGKNTGVGCHFLLQCMKVKSESEVAQSCPTFCDPMDCSPPGSSVHGICQARVLEWGAIAFSNILKQTFLNLSLTLLFYKIKPHPLQNTSATSFVHFFEVWKPPGHKSCRLLLRNQSAHCKPTSP